MEPGRRLKVEKAEPFLLLGCLAVTLAYAIVWRKPGVGQGAESRALLAWSYGGGVSVLMELGRLTQDVSVEDVAGGKKVLNNCVAIRLSKNATTFLDVTAWDDTAVLIATYFRKGYEILFSGRLVNKKKFVSKGVEVQSVCAVIDKVHFFNGNPREGVDAYAEDDFLK